MGEGEVEKLSTKVVAHLHDIVLYEVQSAGHCAEFHTVELYICGIHTLSTLGHDVWWDGIPSVALRDQSRMFPRVG